MRCWVRQGNPQASAACLWGAGKAGQATGNCSCHYTCAAAIALMFSYAWLGRCMPRRSTCYLCLLQFASLIVYAMLHVPCHPFPADHQAYKFAVPMRKHATCDFSYAGLKTSVRLAIEQAVREQQQQQLQQQQQEGGEGAASTSAPPTGDGACPLPIQVR